ncbi:hypothetical protein GXP67_03855 [Rhodocytophaga rosea]|uniref:Uncharacterized protein n=1 Tax=Rhodocytophaga rosea TaxID=2704465 RepID=A0A6C0GDV2_9BACT|nr:hypothetical protein [Rhodocytophaga rosea]QHT65860.1 hypothetical protein GXP67_03855 [Rhodocytophaga rosea]
MNTTYLAYSKQILEKVSFDKYLFEKELHKAIEILPEVEISELYNWCITAFGSDYLSIIQQSFNL